MKNFRYFLGNNQKYNLMGFFILKWTFYSFFIFCLLDDDWNSNKKRNREKKKLDWIFKNKKYNLLILNWNYKLRNKNERGFFFQKKTKQIQFKFQKCKINCWKIIYWFLHYSFSLVLLLPFQMLWECMKKKFSKIVSIFFFI